MRGGLIAPTGRGRATFEVVGKWHAQDRRELNAQTCGHAGHSERHRLRAGEIGPYSREQAECRDLLLDAFFEGVVDAVARIEHDRVAELLASSSVLTAQTDVLLEVIDRESDQLIRDGRVPPLDWPGRAEVMKELGIYGVCDRELASELLGLPPDALDRAARDGTLKTVPHGDDWFIAFSELERFAIETKTPRRPPRGGGPWALEVPHLADSPFQLYTLQATAKLLAVPVSFVRELIDSGDLAVVELGRGTKPRVAASELDRFIGSRRN